MICKLHASFLVLHWRKRNPSILSFSSTLPFCIFVFLSLPSMSPSSGYFFLVISSLPLRRSHTFLYVPTTVELWSIIFTSIKKHHQKHNLQNWNVSWIATYGREGCLLCYNPRTGSPLHHKLRWLTLSLAILIYMYMYFLIHIFNL